MNTPPPKDGNIYYKPVPPIKGYGQPMTMDFNLDGTKYDNKAPIVIEEEEDKQKETTAAEFLKIHQDFGHCSFTKLRKMAQKGTINPKFKNANIPVCSACLYAKVTRKQWRSKTAKNPNVYKPIKPGECVSVDQLVSPTPGLVAQLTGKLTTARYRYATFFFDQY